MEKTDWRIFAEKLRRADMDTREKTEAMLDWLLKKEKSGKEEQSERQEG